MALYLVELTPAQPSKDEATALIETVNSSLTNGAELIETQVSADHKIVFVIVESENTAFGPDLAAAIGERASVEGPDAVRLVGAEQQTLRVAEHTIAQRDDISGEFEFLHCICKTKPTGETQHRIIKYRNFFLQHLLSSAATGDSIL